MASSSRLKPGDEGKIVATIDMRGKIGYITKTVKVYTNDPKRPVVNLVLKALVKAKPASLSQPTAPPQSASPLQSAPPSQPASQ